MPSSDFPWYSGMSEEEIAARREEIERSKRDFFADARDGFYISTREGRFLDCNKALVKMLGYESAGEVLSMDLPTDLWCNPHDRRRFQELIEKQGFVSEYECLFLHKSGKVLHVRLSSHVWRDARGNISGYRGFVVDCTQEKMMRERLRSLETKYWDLFNNMRDGVFVTDERGTIVDCNMALCDIIGYTRDEFLALDYYRKLFVDSSALMEFRRKFTRQGWIRDYELQIVCKDGAIRDISLSGYSTRDSAGRIVSYEGMMRDVTEANRLRQQLIQSEKLSAMGRMACQLAHELNNPIYGILNCLELVKSAVPEGDARKRYFDLAEVECKRTSGLLVKMLKYFQPDHDRPSPTNINYLLEETLLFYEKQFSSLNIKVTTDLAPDLPSLTAVGSQLKQVFINMIINANNAMPRGGTLTVASRYHPGQREVQVSIGDTGVGIPAGEVERIFEAFYSTKSEVKGVGLGLSICYEVIKNHGGHIDVQSEVGKGTVFTTYLPVREGNGQESL